MADLRTNISALLLADFKAEGEAGFPTVRRIPSTDAVKFLDYFAALNSAEAAALLDALARGHAMQFFPPSALHREGLELRELSESNSALVQFRDATRMGQFAYGLRYQDVRHVRTALRDPVTMRYMAETRSKLDFVPRDDPPSQLMPEPDRLKVQTANAPLLRKLIDKAFAQLFAPLKTRQHGALNYTGSIGSTELTVSVIFSNMYGQLHWWVNMPMLNPNLKAARVQDFWGAYAWNYLTEENAPRSIDLLCERIVYFANLRERIDALPA
jgi:hypothetical protein